MSETVDRVSAVHIYPIKSCGEATINGQLPTELPVGSRGFEYGGFTDRGLVIHDESYLFVSQRGWDENQAMRHRSDRILATVSVDIQPERLVVNVKNFGTHVVPLEGENKPQRSVRIFGPELPVLDEGDKAANFFSELLRRSVRFTRADPTRPRILPDRYCRPGAANQVAGADGRPFSLASQASLDQLHDLLDLDRETWPLTQYRANIDIGGYGIGPFGEDRIVQAQIGSTIMNFVKALPRCPIPNIRQSTSDDTNRLSTRLLRLTRTGWAAGDSRISKPERYFAQSLNHVYTPGEEQLIGIGSKLVVLVAGESNVIFKDEVAPEA